MLSFKHSGELGSNIAIWIPSLGQTSDMWAEISSSLDDWSHIFVDLPGHGSNAPATERFTLAELAEECLEYLKREAKTWDRVLVVGLSIGGIVALELARLLPKGSLAVVMGAGATMGDPKVWQSRADIARTSGTASMKDAARARWFTEEFVTSHPEKTNRALDSLGSVDGEPYALCSEALGSFDGTQLAKDIAIPVLVLSATNDEVSPPENGRSLSELIPSGEYVEIPDAKHLFPIEKSNEVTGHILDFVNHKN